MTVQEKIRSLREQNNLTQTDMAVRMNLSQNGYAKLERGESKLNLEKLQQLSDIFEIDITELVNTDKGFNYQYSDNSSSNNYYSNSGQEIEKLHLIITYKDELLAQKDNEITALKKLLTMYENQ
ncbi:MAG: helix-turn-helix transcriptional regulator [Moraxellaceae bacterium]|nr:helix-turn-helix transcriptional regulator [Moraxellaceae bacterium]